MALSILVLLAVPAFFVAMAVRIVPETQRFVHVRLGRVLGVLGPGLHVILPFMDEVVRVDLNRDVPDWQSLPAREVDGRVLQLYQRGLILRDG